MHGVTPSTGVSRNAKALAVAGRGHDSDVCGMLRFGAELERGAADVGSAGRTSRTGRSSRNAAAISDQTLGELTRVPGLVNTARNSVGCQWLVGGGILGPHFSFTWYRGSPIGRERKTEELSRASVEDINIEGHNGFIALGEDPTIGNNLCEIGIQFDDDFIEWSISYAEEPFPDPCDVAKELTRQSIVNSK